MAINQDQSKQLHRHMHVALQSIIHARTAVKAALGYAEECMTEAELANSRIYGELCRHEEQCNGAIQILISWPGIFQLERPAEGYCHKIG